MGAFAVCFGGWGARRARALTRPPPPGTWATVSTEPVADSLIPYDEIVQDALRSVVRRVLDTVAKEGLPGAHHFYIAFRTKYPGVVIPKHLAERYPDEMTIVVQHRYWDLGVDDEGFQIGLTFNQVPAKLHIPWSAITGFVDPAVDFALQFVANEGASPPAPPPEPVVEERPPETQTGNVVTLDRFRKK